MFPNILLSVTSTYLWRPKVEDSVDFYNIFSGILWLQNLHMYFDHKKNSDLFLYGSSIYLYF